MQKKILKYTILVSVLALLSYLGYGIVQRFMHKKAIIIQVAQLPSFEFRNLQNEPFALKNLAGQWVWLLRFGSECEHCQAEIAEIQRHSTQLSDTKVVLISTEKLETLKRFSESHRLDTLPNIIVLQDSTNFCGSQLGIKTVPSTLLYAPNGRLAKQHQGIITVESIRNDTKATP